MELARLLARSHETAPQADPEGVNGPRHAPKFTAATIEFPSQSKIRSAARNQMMLLDGK
jgi:hypothetical protein